MKGLRLYKKEKLCSAVAIEQLFMRSASGVKSILAYPLRAVWRQNDRRSSDAPVAFVVSVPKKRLHHAVDRVRMRRRIREAYRLARPSYPMPDGSRVDVAFIYVADRLCSYASVEKAIGKIMTAISGKATEE